MSNYFIGYRDADGMHKIIKVEDAPRDQLIAEVMRLVDEKASFNEGFEAGLKIVERVLSAAAGNVTGPL